MGNRGAQGGAVMSKQLIISVMSKDRPGIIADITGVILDLNGDLADLNQSVLGGYFSMILIAEFDRHVTAEDILAGFSHIESETKIEAIVKEMEVPLEIEKQNLPSETFIVTAQGENRKGLVQKMGNYFFKKDINIVDLETTREGTQYTMIFQVDLSRIRSLQEIRDELWELGEQENLDLVLQHNDIFKATHEVGTPVDTIAPA